MNKEQRYQLRKLAEEATPVAYQSDRNGFIAKENKNPEYNSPLYKFDPSTILQLLDYIETLEKDAVRYRWLVDNSYDRSGVTQFHVWKHTWEPHSQTGEPTEWKCRVRGPSIDDSIDAAMQGETK